MNRKLRQRRPLRARLPRPRDVGRVVGRAVGRALRRGAAVVAVCTTFVALTAAGLAAWAWLRSTERFAAREIVVTGSARVDAAEIARVTGVRPGTNLFSVSLTEVERQLLTSPWVEAVKAHRRLPDGLVVDVREKKPAALVLAGSPYLADRQGRPFKRARLESGEADGLPIVTGIERELFGSEPSAAETLVRHALTVHGAWSQGGARPAVGEVHLDERGATLFTAEGAMGIRLGRAALVDARELEQRLHKFDEVWAALSPEERAACRMIHLDGTTRPDRVTVRLLR